jgi:hypothetical protein
MAEFDIIDLSPDGVYVQYSVPQPPFVGQTINIGGSPVTNINGLTGPVINLVGGISGFNYTTSAPSTITLVSPLTTKGDLYTFSGSGVRLGVGADGDVLTADSGEATGLKWAASVAPSTLNIVKIAFADSPYALSDTNDVVLVDTSGGAVTITLHNPTTAKQKYYDVKLITGGNNVTLDGNGFNIDGNPTFVFSVVNSSYTILPDNALTAWYIV